MEASSTISPDDSVSVGRKIKVGRGSNAQLARSVAGRSCLPISWQRSPRRARRRGKSQLRLAR